MNSPFNINELEHIFAKNLSSPIFSIIASTYYEQYKFDKAEKICNVGLKNNPENIVGQYIKAKILLIKGQIVPAEKILKKIINLDINNTNALLTLIEVSKSLNRSQTTINNYIIKAFNILPENKKIYKMYYAMDKRTKTTKPKQKMNFTKKEMIHIDKKMATKTMYKLMMQQKKLTVAHEILKMMGQNRSNKNFINKESKKLKNLINKNNKD